MYYKRDALSFAFRLFVLTSRTGSGLGREGGYFVSYRHPFSLAHEGGYAKLHRSAGEEAPKHTLAICPVKHLSTPHSKPISGRCVIDSVHSIKSIPRQPHLSRESGRPPHLDRGRRSMCNQHPRESSPIAKHTSLLTSLPSCKSHVPHRCKC